MGKVTVMNRANIRLIQEEVREALKGVEEKLGLTIRFKSGTFSESEGTWTPRMEFAILQTADGIDRERNAFAMHCGVFNLKPEQYKARVTIRHKLFEIIGFNLGSPRYVLRARNVMTGKEFKLTEEVLNQIRPAPRAVLAPVLGQTGKGE